MFSNVRSGVWKFWVRPMKFLLHFNLHNLKSDYILHKNTSGNRSNNVIWAQAHWVVWNGYLYARHLQTSKVGNPIMQLPPLVSYFFYGYKYGITFQNFMPNKPRVNVKKTKAVCYLCYCDLFRSTMSFILWLWLIIHPFLPFLEKSFYRRVISDSHLQIFGSFRVPAFTA